MLDIVENNATLPGSIDNMVQPTAPAVLAMREVLRATDTRLATPLAEGRLNIVGARCDLDTGAVRFFAQVPI